MPQVLETVRTFIVWVLSLAVGWQSFEYVQLVGFIVAIAGTSVPSAFLLSSGRVVLWLSVAVVRLFDAKVRSCTTTCCKCACRASTSATTGWTIRASAAPADAFELTRLAAVCA